MYELIHEKLRGYVARKDLLLQPQVMAGGSDWFGLGSAGGGEVVGGGVGGAGEAKGRLGLAQGQRCSVVQGTQGASANEASMEELSQGNGEGKRERGKMGELGRAGSCAAARGRDGEGPAKDLWLSCSRSRKWRERRGVVRAFAAQLNSTGIG